MASTSDSTPVENPSDPTPQALLEVSADGVILWAAPEAAAWWCAPGDKPLAGRTLGALFAETRELGVEAAWIRLRESTRAESARLTAETASGAFAVRVQLAAKGEPDASGRDTYIAEIERASAQDRAAIPPNGPTTPPGSHDVGAHHDRRPQDDTQGLRHNAEPDAADAPQAGDEDRDVVDDDALAVDELDPLADIDLDLDLEAAEPLTPPRVVAPSGEAPTASIESTFAGARLGFFHINFAERSASFSASWKALLGYGAEDVSDDPDSLAALIHPEDSEASPLELRNTGPYSAEVRLRAKDDTWRWVQFEGICAGDANGGPLRLDAVMLDVQERHDSEDETARNEERLLRLTGRGGAGFFEIDLLTDVAWYSPEFRRVLGRRNEDLGTSSEGFLGVLPPEDAAVGLPAFFHSISAGLPITIARYQLVHADGHAIDLEALIAVRRNRRGLVEHVSGIQAIASAAAEERTAPASAPTSAGSSLAGAIQQALDAALEPIVLVDPCGLILHVNGRAAELAGQEPDRLTTRPFHEVFTLTLRATGAPASQLLESAVRSGKPLDLDQTCQIAGQQGPEDVVISCRPFFEEAGRLTGATIVFRRLAEMPLSQAELVKSNRMEALGRLACGIVHDFNNLLTTVVGGVSLAMDKRDLGPLETALRACNNAKNLAKQLLTFARGDISGRRVQSLNEIIRETARMAGAGSKTTVDLELAADLHPVNVEASQIVQVFTNLLLNAMQVMPQGGRIWVRTHNMPLGQVNSVNLPAGDYVRTDVQDNGPGIPPENLARIFEPFFTTRAEGTGLGLAMVNSIVAQHEGAIEASSTVGTGTTFTLYFPRAHTDVVQEAPQKLSISYGSGRVLVMDDDADLCAIASGMLDMLGYKADTATSADEALAKFRKSRELGRVYDAVILDLTMAGGPGGEDVVGQLRAIDPAVKAIVSSGYATEENAEHYRQLGFVGTLAKPYRSGDLGRVLKGVLGQGK